MLLETSVRAISVPTGLPRNEQSSSEISVGLAKPLGARGVWHRRQLLGPRRRLASRIGDDFTAEYLNVSVESCLEGLEFSKTSKDPKRASSETSGVVDTVDDSDYTGLEPTGAGVGVEAAALVDLPYDLVDLPDDFLAA